MLDPDRLFPAEPRTRDLARALFGTVRDLPILSPHGHTDPRWFAEDAPFADPAQLFVTPDHHVFRLLQSRGIAMQALGVPRVETDPRAIWRRFPSHFHLFRGTPSALWLTHSFAEVFGIEEPLSAATADAAYDRIAECLAQPAFRPRALFDRFGIEVLASTEGALDDLRWHGMIRASGWGGRVITTYRPDAVVDPDLGGFHHTFLTLGPWTHCDTATWEGYLLAHRLRRAVFKAHGATASDHGPPRRGPRTCPPPKRRRFTPASARAARRRSARPSAARC